MEIKSLAIPILVALALVATVGATGLSGEGENTEESIPYESMVTVEVNDEVIHQSSNYFTVAGRDWLISQVGNVDSSGGSGISGADSNFIDTMHVGQHPGGDAESLDTRDLSNSVTWSYSSTGNMTTSYEFTANSETTVNGTSIEDSTNGVTFATNPFTDVTLQDGDSIEVTWQVWTE